MRSGFADNKGKDIPAMHTLVSKNYNIPSFLINFFFLNDINLEIDYHCAQIFCKNYYLLINTFKNT